MQKTYRWLLALALAALLLPPALAAAEAAPAGNLIEIGGSAVSIDKDGTSVNHYSAGRADNGAALAGRLNLELDNDDGVYFDLNGSLFGPRDGQGQLGLDLHRAVRFDADYSVLERNLPHDRLDYLDAAVVRGGMNKTTHEPVPLTGVNPDLVPAFILVDGATQQVIYGSDTGDFTSVADDNDYVVQTGGAAVYGEDLTPDARLSVTRREWQVGSKVQLPTLPNLVFHADVRRETRTGNEQFIGMSKCATCHVTGGTRAIDENTNDFKAGVTGKFGLVTIEYEYANRQFRTGDQAGQINYDPVIKPGQPLDNKTFDNRISYDYDDGALAAEVTPESEKQAHLVKGRVDLAGNTTLLASFVTSEVESNKSDEPGIFTLGQGKLTTSYDGYKLRARTRIGQLKLSAYGKLEKVEGDDVEVSYQTITAPTSPAAGVTFGAGNSGSYSASYESLSSRDVLSAGIDAVYRLARRSTLRIGYEYESEDRDDELFGKTETNSLKARLSLRPLRTLSLRLGYTFEDIDNPFGNPDAALVEVTEDRLQAKFGVPAYIVGGNSALYGTSYYDERSADLSNQPQEVNEARLAATWAPSPSFSATLSYRYKDEQNDLNQSRWEQSLNSPSISLWYAASQRLNFTATYNYFDQRTETAFCQGFYDG